MMDKYLRDFQDEFDHSTGRSRYGPESALNFYEKWKKFISLVSGTPVLINPVPLELYSVACVTALKCRNI